MKILIDNGHGVDTKGKCSPDKTLLEYRWCREIASRLEAELKARGYDAQRIVTEETDISLSERVRRVNAQCAKSGAKNCLLISIHINASGADGQWHDARGWSVWIAKTASAESKKFARMLYSEASRRGLRGNRYVPNEHYWTADFTIVTKTNCPAVLTENLFQDNREDVAFLTSETGKNTIVQLHYDAIMNYLKQQK